MKTTQNYSMDELAELLVTDILKETFFRKETLLPKVKAWLKHAIDLKNTPKNYNAYESPSKAAIRLRTIEQKNAEIIFWRDIVKELDGRNMQTHYDNQEKMLKEKGFKTP